MKRQLVVATTLALLVFAASPSFAVNGNIGIFGDTGQAICAADVPYQTTPLRLYVYALQQGASLQGITGAEYSLTMNQVVDWSISEDYTPAITSGATKIGDALVLGVNLAWGGCQTGGGSILLETIDVLDFTGTYTGPATMGVVGHQNPGNPFFRCPLFTLCDDPVFTKVCLGTDLHLEVCPFPPGALACTVSTSGEFFFNPEPGFDCTVGVEETSWSQVKGLYN